MTIKKTYPKTKDVCRVTFRYPANDDVNQIYLVGDFNEWQEDATPMKKNKGNYSVTLELEPGHEYEFRYLINGQEWVNDDTADRYNATPYGADNCVIVA